MEVLEKLKDFEMEQNIAGYSSNEENLSGDYNEEYEEYELAEDNGDDDEEDFGYNEEVELDDDDAYDLNPDDPDDEDEAEYDE